MSGTNETKQSLSGTETTETDEFAAVYKAVLEGNHAELDRLQAVQPVESKETEGNADETTVVTDDETATNEVVDEETKPIEGETPSDKDNEEGNTEAATSAASTASPSEELEALKRELHRYKSDAGRVSHLQRRQAELERELRAYKAREVAPTKKDGSEGTASVPEISAGLKAKIDQLREIDPMLADTMEEIAKATAAVASEKAGHVVEVINKQEQEAEDIRFYNEQRQYLVEQFPQADAVFASPHWKQWKETLSPNKRAMAESGYADEVLVALNAFTADMQRMYPQAAQTAPAATQATPAQTPENKEALEARQRKAASADVKSHSAKKSEPFDAEQAFREMYRTVAKERHLL